MTESSLLVLRQLFLTSYGELKAKLAQRLGSADLADDAVQDTWLRLNRVEQVGHVGSPVNYLYRIALNVARDRILSERRYLNSAEIEKMLDLADETADPTASIEARSELRLVEMFISELPSRQRDILVAARLDGLSRSEIAKRLGISLSLVEKELKSAHEYCLARRKQMRK
ncbi:RNA polymerase sigma factor [Bradyrhizobium cenepequi]|uniref:RNA polymerase sigma factor n=1 Tax=Bradyrhizobium cenepequi TaxID=2821403 RepID=UPI001CE3AD58|nr:RNA polymerase sigma factor [Bradyrhizobium cenepequi]MCA6109662.1 RNA polymerase sigma factor [Bradyrhizobium cenepequi]